MNHKSVVNKLYHCFKTQDFLGMQACLDANVVWKQMKGFPGGGTYHGVNNVCRSVFASFHKDWDNWHAVTEEIIETTDGACAIGYYEGTFRETNKYMKAAFASFYKIKNGKIAIFTQYTDTLLIAEAMDIYINKSTTLNEVSQQT
jgi:ketosteroid isomerase-like protein